MTWGIATPTGNMSFPELGRYTKSDLWDLEINDDAYDSEEDALVAIAEFQVEGNGWFATWERGTPSVSTIVEPQPIECEYCGNLTADPGDDPVPAVDDDDAWAEEAREHQPDCEWILTRAHRLEGIRRLVEAQAETERDEAAARQQ